MSKTFNSTKIIFLQQLSKLAIFVFFLFSTSAAFASSNQDLPTTLNDQLAQEETTILGKTNQKLPISQRLDLLEKVLFGSTNTGSFAFRIQQIDQQLGTSTNTLKSPVSESATISIDTAKDEKTNEDASLELNRANLNTKMPTDPEILQNLANRSLETQDYGQAQKYLTALAKVNPLSAFAYQNLATIDGKLHNYAQSMVDNSILHYINPTSIEAKLQVAWLENYFKRMVDPRYHIIVYYRSPRDPRFLLNQGVRLYSMGFLNEADELFEYVSNCHPHNFNAWYNLGVVAEKQNKLPEALKYYQMAKDCLNRHSYIATSLESGIEDLSPPSLAVQKAIASINKQLSENYSTIGHNSLLSRFTPSMDTCDRCRLIRGVKMAPD